MFAHRRANSAVFSIAVVLTLCSLLTPTSFGIDSTQPITSSLSDLSFAAGGVTGAALLAEANQILDGLKDLAAHLTGDLSTAINGSITQFGGLVAQFDDMVQNDITKPIQQLSAEAQELAREIRFAGQTFTYILDHEAACLVQNAGVIQAALDSLTRSLKEGIPLLSKPGARLYYFQFTNHSPSIVPIAGGPLTVEGFALWNRKPKLELTDENHVKIVPLQVFKGASDNEVQSSIDGTYLKPNIGKCLYLHCQTQKAHYVLWEVPDADFYLPMYIPKEESFQLLVTAELDYQYVTTAHGQGGEQEYRVDNPVCENGIPINITHGWSLPAGAKIVNYTYRQGEFEREPNTATVGFSGSLITVTGTLAPAACSGPWKHLSHTAIYQHFIAPVYDYPSQVNKPTSGATPQSNPNWPTTRLLVDLPRDKGDGPGSFSYKVIPILNGIPQEPLYVSPRVSYVQGSTDVSDQGTGRGCRIDGHLNPDPTGGHAQLAVTVTFDQCGI